MHSPHRATGAMPRPGGRRPVAWIVAAIAIAAPGCGAEPKIEFTSVAEPPTVQLIRPPVRKIARVVGQPSFIESYERTSIYPKMTAYIEKWIVDIGDKVKKGDVFATLFVPELVEDYGTKKADVALAKERIELARKVVEVTEADVKAAQARVVETEADLKKYQAEVDRWDVQVARLNREVERGVIDPQILLESTNQLKSSTASRDAAKAVILKAQADLLAQQAALAKARVDVSVAKARLAVADSEERRLKAWVGYLTLTAPFDGVIVARNANTGDFVLPATGDPTADVRAPDLSPSGKAAPIYVVDRLDVVRIFVDIPEADANYVAPGAKATVMARAYRDAELPATVTRTSWALNVKSRTLRAEIDLPNPNSQLLPGMYAYAKVMIDRPGVRAIPLESLINVGDQSFCLTYKDGHAVRTEVQTGVNDGQWVEVTNRRVAPAIATGPPGADAPWSPVDGTEEVIVGDLSVLADGSAVRVAAATGATAEAGQAGQPSAARPPAPGQGGLARNDGPARTPPPDNPPVAPQPR